MCCLAAEAKDPNRVLPLAVFGTISIVTVFYCFASMALVGMQNYKDISINSGFSEAFHSRGYIWSQNIVAIGEIITLPLVVLVSFLAQPRLQYAMASDGLLPKIFTEIDRKGNFIKGILISGLICTIIAIFVPFKYLDDMISAGVLISFNLTNTSLIAIRRGDSNNPNLCNMILLLFNIICIILHILLVNINFTSSIIIIYTQFFIILSLFALLLSLTYYIHIKCPENEDNDSMNQFRVPYLPFIPLFGIFINYLLLAQLSYHGILLVLIYFGIACLFYFGYGIHHSKGNNTGWRYLLTPEIDKIESNQKYMNLNGDEDQIVITNNLNNNNNNNNNNNRYENSLNSTNYNNNFSTSCINNDKSVTYHKNHNNKDDINRNGQNVESVHALIYNVNGTKNHQHASNDDNKEANSNLCLINICDSDDKREAEMSKKISPSRKSS